MARERERNYVRWIDGELFQERIALWDREEKEVDVDVVDEIEIKSFPYFLDFFLDRVDIFITSKDPSY